ncbi:MAG: nucleoside deaminase [Phycisphaerales bacterium]|nr:MAG: nucleoside deaminase [Phycisphaerales bacterium]
MQCYAPRLADVMFMTAFTELMRHAIEAARRGIAAGDSPFGAAIARCEGDLIVTAHNTVLSSSDSTAHAEINAIREACAKLGRIDLRGHIMATTCEPCPMCAAAIHWAGLDAVAFGATIFDASKAGFSELSLSCAALYEQGGSTVTVHTGVLSGLCRTLFDAWLARPGSRAY